MKNDIDFPAGAVVSRTHLLERIEILARDRPDSFAVVDECSSATYGELNRRANILASILGRRGVKPGHYVALALGRSVDFVVGVVAAWKLRAAYVPLDEDFSPARLKAVFSDVSPAIVLASAKSAVRLGPYADRVFFMDRVDYGAVGPECREPPPLDPASDAYIIYTSGSTGVPNGVPITHEQLARYVDAVGPATELGGVLNFALVSTTSADLGNTAIFGSLVSGGCLHIFSRDRVVDPLAFAEGMRGGAIDVLKITPSHLAAVHRYGGRDVLPRRTLLLGGEIVPGELVEFLSSSEPDCSVYNHYGPTETTVGASVHRMKRSPDVARGTGLPIGKPIAGARFFLVDENLREVEEGEIGELCIGGPNVSAGYVNRPGLNLERFICLPASGDSQIRVFRTGDRARKLPSGEYEFLGRRDDQIKLRGYRVEPGEIESILKAHRTVEQCVVVPVQKDGRQTEQALQAFVVLNEESRHSQQQRHVSDEERVAHWNVVHDTNDEGASRDTDLQFDTVRWNSSYSGLPLSDPEMREWVDATVERILELRPRRVLEIGCGFGLLLFRVARHCEYYHGTDFTEKAIDNLRRTVSRSGPANVELSVCDATDLPGCGSEYDLVIINSVVQHFPSAQYLSQVVGKALDHLTDDGRIFICDVRSLPLLELFHSSVAMFQCPTTMSLEGLEAEWRRRVTMERELVVDPRYFELLPSQLPSIKQVSMQLKRGSSANEMIRYRYDVVLSRKAEREDRQDPAVLHWRGRDTSLATVESALEEGRYEAFKLTGVGNLRLHEDISRLKMLRAAEPSYTVGMLRSREIHEASEAVDPEVFWSIGKRHGYFVEISWSSEGYEEGLFDVAFARSREMLPRLETGRPSVAPATRGLANDPRRVLVHQQARRTLHEYLSEELPGYMLPVPVTVVEAIPLTSNGKIDRWALAASEAACPFAAEVRKAPETLTEKKLARLWMEMLDIDVVGVGDSFFGLGGHSLLVVQLISRVRERWRVSLRFSDIFEHPTLRDVAALLDRRAGHEIEAAGDGSRSRRGLKATGTPGQDVGENAGPDAGEPPLSFSQQALWFLSNLAPEEPRYNIVYRWDLAGDLDTASLERSLRTVVARHDILRTAFPVRNGRPVQVVDRRVTEFEVKREDLDGLPENEQQKRVDAAVEADMRNPMDLQQGPLFEARLFKFGERRYLLTIRVHHIIFDGRSRDVLVGELNRAYADCLVGKQPALPPVPLQYADFSRIQRERLNHGSLESDVSWWRERLEEADTTTGLIPETRRGDDWNFSGERIPLDLGTQRSLALRRFCIREEATAFNILAASIAIAIASVTGRRDITLGADTAGRTQQETESLIGFFVNQFVLRVVLDENVGVSELIAHVQRESALAQNRQDVPFDRLVGTMREHRTHNRMPLYEVKLALQTSPPASLELPGVQSRMSVDLRTVDCDLIWDLSLASESTRGWIKYNPAVLELDEMERLKSRFLSVLDRMIRSPDARLAELFRGLEKDEKLRRDASLSEFQGMARERFREIAVTGRRANL